MVRAGTLDASANSTKVNEPRPLRSSSATLEFPLGSMSAGPAGHPREIGAVILQCQVLLTTALDRRAASEYDSGKYCNIRSLPPDSWNKPGMSMKTNDEYKISLSRQVVQTCLACPLVPATNNQVVFRLQGYDRRRALVIDPVLTYSSHLGGSGYESGQAIAVDSAGNAYVTGDTTSAEFPTANPLQPSFGTGSSDVFVTKLNAMGSGPVYSTFLGGGAGNWPNESPV